MSLLDYQREIDSAIYALDKALKQNLIQEPLLKRANLLRSSLNYISNHKDVYDLHVDHEQLKHQLPVQEALAESQIRNSLDLVARAIYRKFIASGGQYNPTERDVLLNYSPFNNEATDDEKFELLYQGALVSDLVGKHLVSIREAERTSKKLISEHEKKISDWKSELTRLDSYVKNLETEFNFVGLSKAFSDMEKKTIAEKKILNFGLFGIGIFALLIPFMALVIRLRGIDLLPSLESLSTFLPIAALVISIEVILIYFFRVILKQQQSAKAQILQLRLRKSLCAFIEGYVEFAKANKNIEKFEALIFSGLTPNPDSVPSTFDGLESITSLVKNLRATGNS